MLKPNELYHGDCMNYFKQIDDKSIDLVLTDPPYGVLGNHKIETNVDIATFASECKRVLKDNAFIAVFGLLPSFFKWNNELEKHFKFCEHITWVKRIPSSCMLPILRTHEDIFIYKKGNPKYYETKGRYEDVKVDGLLYGLIDIETIKCTISDLAREIKRGKPRIHKEGKNKNDDIYNGMMIAKGAFSPDCNFTNVWSFTPHNRQSFNNDEFNVKHPTVKPIELMNRLCELLSDKNALILDPFIGSGTTAVACLETDRRFIGIEKDLDYYNIACARVHEQKKKVKLPF